MAADDHTSIPSTSAASSSQRPAPLNIPVGNSAVTPDAPRISEQDRLTGDRWVDYQSALKRINLSKDLQNATQIPCFRNSMLWGIGGGVGVGAVRAIWTSRPSVIGSWTVISFVLISAFQWETCRSARQRELQQMRMIQENYPHRHISRLKRASQPVEEAASIR